MKLLTTAAFIALVLNVFAQQSETLVPQDAVSVFSVNNVNLLQKISLDELLKYEFMEEVQQELFDGSTSGRTLKDSGVDFEQRMNFFQGQGNRFHVSGFTLGIADREQFFMVFDDYQQIDSPYPGVDFYESYFNRIAIKGNAAVLFRVEPRMSDIEEVTDSIWYSRGNDYPWYFNDYFDDPFMEEGESTEPSEIEQFFEQLEFIPDENESEEDSNNPIEDVEPLLADENPSEKTYYELRDSVEVVFQLECMKRLCDELFIRNENLMNFDPNFAQLMERTSEGTFYLDNARNFEQENEMEFIRMIYPKFMSNIEELYEDNIVLGDLNIADNQIELDLDVRYREKLGDIFQEMTNTKFDKNVLKYIREDNGGFVTCNINMRKAYETAFEHVVPLLLDSEGQISLTGIMIELADELIDKDAVFDLYQGSMFGAYNGIKTIKTKKIIFEYDEDTFEYIEHEVEAEEEMPVFTVGFTTKRSDIPAKVLDRLTRVLSNFKSEEDYWVMEGGVLGAAPLYFVLQNDLVIVTNDDDLARNHAGGYGAESIKKKDVKLARKGGMMYANVNTDRAVDNLPRGMFTDYENELINVIRGKSGEMILTTSKSTSTSTGVNVAYNYDGQYDSAGTYILDLINSLYVISK